MAPVPPMVSVPVVASKFHVTSPVAASERLLLMVLLVLLLSTAASPLFVAAISTLFCTVLLASVSAELRLMAYVWFTTIVLPVIVAPFCDEVSLPKTLLPVKVTFAPLIVTLPPTVLPVSTEPLGPESVPATVLPSTVLYAKGLRLPPIVLLR